MTRRAGQAPGSDPRSWPVRNSTSYGGVAVRGGAGGLEVALIRPRTDGSVRKAVWALPKGASEPGEDPASAALREVAEETGLQAEIVCPLEPVTYWFAWPAERVRYRKTVHFFLMRVTGGTERPDGYEVAEVGFFPLSDAIAVAAYPSERKVLERAAALARAW